MPHKYLWYIVYYIEHMLYIYIILNTYCVTYIVLYTYYVLYIYTYIYIYIYIYQSLEWVVISFSRGYSSPWDQTQVSCFAGRFFTIWTTREALYIYIYIYMYICICILYTHIHTYAYNIFFILSSATNT